MSAFLKITLASIAIPVILSVGLGPAGAQSAPRPLYNSIPHERQNLPPPTVTSPGIVLTDETNATPAKSVDDANRKLAARTAEAIRWTTNHSLPNFINFPGQPCSDSIDDCLNFWKVIKPGEDNNEENLGFSLLAKMAYQDYFNDDAQGQVYRDQVRIKLSNEHPGTTGTSPNIDIGPLPFHWHGEYDVLLQSYVAMYYKYYDILDPDTKNKLFNELLSVRGPYPYFPGNYLLISASIPFIIPFGDYNVFVPETENHILMIETARYLTNQLLFQQEVANAAAEGRAPEHDQYDNNRNGGGQDGKPPLVVFILGMLQNILTSDFTEYNARPYQDYSMVAVMNLAAYAYDDRVKLAARMVLDYISAKVAVSSNNLGRSVPYRRLNELKHFGPFMTGQAIDGGTRTFLNTSLNRSDPQTGFYSLLAGNTGTWNGLADGGLAYEMVHAGLRDYRIPWSILDLFVTPSHRRFYQRFHHFAPTALGNTDQYADEIYAASPNYLISAGGHPTYYSGVTYLSIGPDQGVEPDRGVAVPTTFLPTSYLGPRASLGDVIQFGQFGTDSAVTSNLGVAPDFACGDLTTLPRIELLGSDAPWFFLDGSASGYYLAVFGFNPKNGVSPQLAGDPAFLDGGFLEAFDTSLHPGISFEDFKAGVLAKNGSTNFQFPGENTYITSAGQQIRFRIAPGVGDIISTSDVPEPPERWKGKFASGDILNSEQGSGIIDISNPSLGTNIRLDMSVPLNPRRTSESGEFESAGVPNEVWVDFKYSGAGRTQNGDFGDPFKTLATAQKAVAVGGTIKIVPGETNERLVIDTKMTVASFPGSATIGRQ